MSPQLGQSDRPRLLPATACRLRAHLLLRRPSVAHLPTDEHTSVQLIQPGLRPPAYQLFLPRPPRARELEPRCLILDLQGSKQQCANAVGPIDDSCC
jgi:hypothetical protein